QPKSAQEPAGVRERREQRQKSRGLFPRSPASPRAKDLVQDALNHFPEQVADWRTGVPRAKCRASTTRGNTRPGATALGLLPVRSAAAKLSRRGHATVVADARKSALFSSRGEEIPRLCGACSKTARPPNHRGTNTSSSLTICECLFWIWHEPT